MLKVLKGLNFRAFSFIAMDLQIKTFRIQSESDERALNEFLVGKYVRHWATDYTPAGGGAIDAITHALSGSAATSDVSTGGIWNVLIAYETRQKGDGGHRSERESSHPFAPRKLPERYEKKNQSAAPAKAKEKAPAEEYKPNISADDMPLFEAIRKWRNARAREERVKPFALFNNRQLEEIVNQKPSTAEALKAIGTDMSAELWEKYTNELLGFIEAAKSVGSTVSAEAEATV